MSKPELGTKRQCQSCATKFYDLNRDPIVCPKCGTVFVAAAALLPRGGRGAEAKQEEAEPEAVVPEAEIVSLDEAAAEEAKEEVADDEVEEAAETDDALLEEAEEDEDDVAGLIDGDIEDDEEA